MKTLAVTLLALLASLALVADAQMLPELQQGITPQGTYHGSDIDTVNLYNGNLNLHIPLISYPQVGGKLQFGFHLGANSKNWVVASVQANGSTQYFWQRRNPGVQVLFDDAYQIGLTHISTCDPEAGSGCASGGGGGGGGKNPTPNPCIDPSPYCCLENPLSVNCNGGKTNVVTDGSAQANAQPQVAGGCIQNCIQIQIWSIIDQDGGTHLLSTPGTNTPNCTGNWTGDGTGLSCQTNGIVDKRGNTYAFNAQLAAYDPGNITQGSVTDTNGNAISFAKEVWTDTLSRQINASMVPAGTHTLAWSIPAVVLPISTSGCPPDADLSYSATYPGPTGSSLLYIYCFTTKTFTSNFQFTNVTEGSEKLEVLTSVILPDSTSWAFTYDGWGDISQINLPSGGTISYVYSIASIGLPTRVVASRTTTDANGTTSEWQYSNYYSSPATKVINPDQSYEAYSFTAWGNPAQTDYYDIPLGNSSAHLKTTTTSYANPTAAPISSYMDDGSHVSYFNTEPTQTIETVYLPSSKSVSKSHSISYDPGVKVAFADGWASAQSGQTVTDSYVLLYGVPVQTVDYDYGSATSGTNGSVLRTTNTVYEWQANSAYLTANLLDLPCITTSYGSGSVPAPKSVCAAPAFQANQLAQESLTYDESPMPVAARGNLTTDSKWISGSNFASTHATYNTVGVKTLSTDANGNQTSFSSFACSGALPQSVIKAYGSTTTVPETFTYAYDCNSGKVTKYTDQNTVAATYSYSDAFGRITDIHQATSTSAEAWIKFGYPSATQITRAEDRVVKGDLLLKSNSSYDGLEREITSITTNGARVDTTYDLMGHVASTSTPYFATSDSTYGVTKYVYDGLGRKTQQTNPDQSSQDWCYNCTAEIGSATNWPWMVWTDEAENQRQYSYDGLGRLAKVVEPNGTSSTPSIETDYAYDGLGNLKSVTQTGSSGTRSRTFQYDGLSRLISAFNPETGTISYSYDANGNLTTKSSPAVNAQTGTQAIGFCYDGLNRVTYKFYTGSFNCTSPSGYAASYSYDSSAVSGAQNVVGHLTDEKSYAGTTLVSERQPFAYDALGRLGHEIQTVLPGTASAKSFFPIYQYDLAGDLIASTDGTTPIQSANASFPSCVTGAPSWSTLTLVTCFNNAAQTQSVTSNWGNYPTNVFTIAPSNGYAPSNQLQQWSQGTTSSGTPAMSVTQIYNSRLWLKSITATGTN